MRARSPPSGRASRRTRRCRGAAPGRCRPGTCWPAHRAAPFAALAASAHSAEFSSPCMWISRFAPARSCRSSTFWVTISNSPGHSASSAPVRSARRWGDFGQLGAARVVEAVDQRRIAGERLAACRHPRRGGLPTARRDRGRWRAPLSAETPAPVRMTILRMPVIATARADRVRRVASPSTRLWRRRLSPTWHQAAAGVPVQLRANSFSVSSFVSTARA
jgi:hypothetical protein